MDNQRLFTFGLFGLLFFMSWQAWQLDYNTPRPVATPAVSESAQVNAPTESTSLPQLSEQLAVSEDTRPQLTEERQQVAEAGTGPSGQLITVKTDVLELSIDTRGGDIVSAKVLKYPVAKDTPDEVIQLFGANNGDFGRFQTGLITPNTKPEPTHFAQFAAGASRYELESGADTLRVPLTWKRADGVVVTKTYTFGRGLYQIDLHFDVYNGGTEPMQALGYAQIVKTAKLPKRSMVDVDTYSFQGPVMFDGEKYQKYAIDDLEDDGAQTFNATGGWIAAIQHHFLVAIIPPGDEQWRYDVALNKDLYNASALGEQESKIIAPETTVSFPVTLFVGPKLQSQLEEISPKLKLTVDYGILTLRAQPLFWLLDKVHDLVKNWGLAIILVTVLIKLAFYRLTASSGRSMAKMRSLQPRMKKLQERYKDDRQALSREMMDLYKREKVNPAAGCLPILIQMPFFLAFYWVLLESVEMRQAPFMLWINDLSSRDPFFVLPLLMGAAMFFQQKLNPAPADPMQAKVMSVLPVVFTVFFAFFPAGLVLYWLTNTLLSIAQQWRINKLVAAEELARKK